MPRFIPGTNFSVLQNCKISNRILHGMKKKLPRQMTGQLLSNASNAKITFSPL